MPIEKMKLKINFGPRQFIVNCADYTYERATVLAEKVAEVRRHSSLFAKYPMEEGESREKWRQRIEPLLENDVTRKEGETVPEHLARLYESKIDSHENTLEILNAIAESFSIMPLTSEDVKKSNWLEVKAFVYDVLNLGDIPCEEYRPKILSAGL